MKKMIAKLLTCFFCAVGTEPPQLSVSEERHLAILTELPFVVPFEERVKVLFCVGFTYLTLLQSYHSWWQSLSTAEL